MSLTGQIVPPLTLEQLVFLFRERMDDLPGDIVSTNTSWQNDDDGLLWKNQEIARYADEAQQELAHRKPILESDVNQAITHLAVSGTNQNSVNYDSKILKIDRVKFVATATGDEYLLTKRDTHWMDKRYNQWDKEGGLGDQGVPCFYVDYIEEYQLRLYPVPDVAGSLHLTIWRLPLTRLNWTTRHQLIEAQTQHHLDLLDWMQYRGYLKRDAETENAGLAGEHKAIFDERIGPRPSAQLQAIRRREARMSRRVSAHFV